MIDRQPTDWRAEAEAEAAAYPRPRTPRLVPRVLAREEMEDLLARNAVGRLAFTFHDRVDVLPITYAFDGRWIYCRTGHGQKLATLRHNPWVAFEVDEVEGPFSWRSVVVHGTVYLLESDGPPIERAAWRRALAILGETIPEAFGDRDPTPERTVLFRIEAAELTGRAAG